METITITHDQLGKLIEVAFKAGENFGTSYATWYTPEPAETQKTIETAKKAAYKVAKIKEPKTK